MDMSRKGARLKSHLQLLPRGTSEQWCLCFLLTRRSQAPADSTVTVVPTTLTPTRGLAPGPGVWAPLQVEQGSWRRAFHPGDSALPGAPGMRGGPACAWCDTVSATATGRRGDTARCWRNGENSRSHPCAVCLEPTGHCFSPASTPAPSSALQTAMHARQARGVSARPELRLPHQGKEGASSSSGLERVALPGSQVGRS